MTELMRRKNKKVFISHAAKDVDFVRLITELLEDIGMNEEQMVCSSIPEYGIPLDEDIYDWLSSQFQNFDLHVLFVLSKNYYDSVACLNEMGAAWVLKNQYSSILLPGFTFQDIKGAVNPNQISIKLDSDERLLKHHLNELKDKLVEEFGLPKPSASKWERHRDAFIEKVRNEVAVSLEMTEDDDRSEPEFLTTDAEELLVNAAYDPNGRILVMKMLGGSVISTNGKNFTVPGSTPREEARWCGAIDELERYELIQAASYKRQVFTVTREGYAEADNVRVAGRFADVVAYKSD